MDPAAGTSATLDVRTDACVVTVTGALTVAALAGLRTSFDAALARHPDRIVLDLSGTAPPSAGTLAVLGAARRYLGRRGVALTLSATPPVLTKTLREAHVDALYEMHPTVASAVKASSRTRSASTGNASTVLR
jgi:anti-anti-sigma regulatory factor